MFIDPIILKRPFRGNLTCTVQMRRLPCLYVIHGLEVLIFV